MPNPTLIERLEKSMEGLAWKPSAFNDSLVKLICEAITALSSPPAQMPEPRQPLTLDDDESCPFCGPGKEYDRKQALSSPPSIDLHKLSWAWRVEHTTPYANGCGDRMLIRCADELDAALKESR